ncbi:LCP family protein [Microcella daejeonensis]|uniref:LCP family protein n=1 Tax=Microcella daejeonensis TaxID=2994971 RepID=A0A9E8S9D6_9MICO|nr:LCP family protein [Microcella daejeonensis]WAB82550.1 LCP family protein [Microcella daejeonensis]
MLGGELTGSDERVASPATRRDRAARDAPLAVARHGRLRRHAWWRTALAGAATLLAVVLVSGASLAAIVTTQLAANIDTVEIGDPDAPLPTVGEWEGGFNVLIVGVDNVPGQTTGGGRDATLNDVNLLVHVAEDQQSAVAVSIPRDLIVPIPSCPTEDGEGSFSAMSAQQFNVAFSYGGLNCVVQTAEALTGLEIPYAGYVGFDGVARMSTAVGGVDVCITAPIVDPEADLNLPEAGEYTLEGYEALGFLRTRYGIGDGGDLSRISNQQAFLSSMIRKLQSEGTLTNIPTLYSLAQVTTESMTLSSSLANLDTLVSMAQVLAGMPTENIVFTQYPGTIPLSGPNTGRVIPLEEEAQALFDRIRADERFLPEEPENGTEAAPGAGGGVDAPAEPSPSPTASADPTTAPGASTPPVLEGVPGQTAAEARCAVGRG